MSVDYLYCEHCNATFCDCGHWGHCANCEERLYGICFDTQQEKYGSIGEDHEKSDDYRPDSLLRCDFCSGNIIQDSDIVDYLIDAFGLDRERLEEEVKEYKKRTKENGEYLE